MKFYDFGPAGFSWGINKTKLSLDCGASLFNSALKRKVIMRINIVLILMTTALFQVSASTYAQKITLAKTNASIVDIFKDIQAQSDYDFIYSNRLIIKAEKINIHVAEASLLDVLEICFKNQPFTYSIKDRTIVIKEKEHFFRKQEIAEVNLLIDISGKVIDKNGLPVPGVSVKYKGSSTGTVTDADGNYKINTPNGTGTMVFSSIGYITQEVAMNSRSKIDIVLAEDLQGLDEVVVVGYGTQKKVNLTGSVSSVSAEQLEKRVATKSSLVLQGQMSGIQVRQGGGNPASNGASLVVRGQGTFSGAGNNPLVLVDGIEASLDLVDPNDIQSVSVLKDAASAAIFGSKAANGVILVETKKGIDGKAIFSFNTYLGMQNPTSVPEMVNSWEYAEVVNDTYLDRGQQKRYSDDEIQKFRSGTDPNYPNFDHINYLFGSGSGIVTRNDISMRGGTAQTQYMFSAGYYDEKGIVKKNYANRYTIRLNLDSKLSEKIRFSVRLAGNINKNTQPSAPYASAGLSGIVSGAMRNSNALPGPTGDGFFGRNETLHPEADLESASFVNNGGSNIYSNGNIVWDLTKDLKINGQIGFTQGDSEYKAFVATYPITPTYSINLSRLNNSWSKSNALTLLSTIEYNKKVSDHTFNLLGGISKQSDDFRSISAYRDALPSNQIYEIDAGATVRGTQGGNASRYTLASYFGRLNYNFRERYLFEANFRYDGSSRFPVESRWGLFPSFSAAWRISQESFFKDAVSWISDLKLRASWGKLGNQSIGNYPYQDLLALGQNYPFGNALSAGAAVSTLANKKIRWETTTINDVGMDISVFNDKLSLSADYFVKNTKDILYNVSVAYMLGATPALTNAGSVENKGWDFNLKYRNAIGDFSYGASAIFSIVHNKVTRLAKIDQDINRGLFVGYPIGSAYGYVSDGLFVSNAEVTNYPKQPFAFLANAGGIKYKDLSGPNGVPDGVVNSSYDRRVIGMPLPTTTYAFTLNGGFKNFDFNVMLQGEGGRKDMVNIGQFFFPLENNGNVQREAYENRWTSANQNPNASYPKIVATTSGFYQSNDVDFWYRDASFLRLKSLQIGYTLPKVFSKQVFLDKMRIYVSGENLFTLTKYYKGWDPEMQTGGTGLFYPLLKTYVAGVSIKF